MESDQQIIALKSRHPDNSEPIVRCFSIIQYLFGEHYRFVGTKSEYNFDVHVVLDTLKSFSPNNGTHVPYSQMRKTNSQVYFIYTDKEKRKP